MSAVEKVARAEARLAIERQKLDRVRVKAVAACRSSEAATPGGLTGYDPAILSGTRRRGGQKAEARRFAAYDREAAASKALAEQEQRVKVAEYQVEQARRDAVAPCDVDALKPGWLVRTARGWERVVRVNAKTVSVETGYSWTDRIRKELIIETRAPKAEVVA